MDNGRLFCSRSEIIKSCLSIFGNKMRLECIVTPGRWSRAM